MKKVTATLRQPTQAAAEALGEGTWHRLGCGCTLANLTAQAPEALQIPLPELVENSILAPVCSVLLDVPALRDTRTVLSLHTRLTRRYFQIQPKRTMFYRKIDIAANAFLSDSLPLFTGWDGGEGNLPPRVGDKAITADMSAAHPGTRCPTRH